MSWPVDRPKPPVLRHKRVIAAREIVPLVTMGAEFPPGTPHNVMRALLGAMNGVNEGNTINDEYTQDQTPTEAQPQPTD